MKLFQTLSGTLFVMNAHTHIFPLKPEPVPTGMDFLVGNFHIFPSSYMSKYHNVLKVALIYALLKIDMAKVNISMGTKSTLTFSKRFCEGDPFRRLFIQML